MFCMLVFACPNNGLIHRSHRIGEPELHSHVPLLSGTLDTSAVLLSVGGPTASVILCLRFAPFASFPSSCPNTLNPHASLAHVQQFPDTTTPTHTHTSHPASQQQQCDSGGQRQATASFGTVSDRWVPGNTIFTETLCPLTWL